MVYKKRLKRVTKLHHKEWEDYKERKGETKKLETINEND